MAACTAARPPEENGKTPVPMSMRRHSAGSSTVTRRIVDGDAPPRGAGALRAPLDLGRPQHEEDGDQDVRGQRRPVPRRRGRRERVLEVGEEAIVCILEILGR